MLNEFYVGLNGTCLDVHWLNRTECDGVKCCCYVTAKLTESLRMDCCLCD